MHAALLRSHIVRYLGIGTSLEDSSFKNEEQARAVARATFLVQEYVDGGSLRGQVLQQASNLPYASSSTLCFTLDFHILQRFCHQASSIGDGTRLECHGQDKRGASCAGLQMTTSHLHKKHYSQEQGLRWLIQIAKGLKYLHTARPVASPRY